MALPIRNSLLTHQNFVAFRSGKNQVRKRENLLPLQIAGHGTHIDWPSSKQGKRISRLKDIIINVYNKKGSFKLLALVAQASKAKKEENTTVHTTTNFIIHIREEGTKGLKNSKVGAEEMERRGKKNKSTEGYF